MSAVVIAVDGHSTREWLQAADIIVGVHRTRRAARAWIRSVHHDYPGCAVAVACHEAGLWCLRGIRPR